MENKDKIASFFPGTKKEIRMNVGGTHPLKDDNEQRRIVVGCVMNLSDGKLLGMPEWIGRLYELVARKEYGADGPKSLFVLDGVNVDVFATDQTKEPSLKLQGCTLKGFVLKRRSKNDLASGELADVELHFALYSNGWVPKLWDWIGNNLTSTFYFAFEGTQMRLSFGSKPEAEKPGDGAEDVQEGKKRVRAPRPSRAKKK